MPRLRGCGDTLAPPALERIYLLATEASVEICSYSRINLLKSRERKKQVTMTERCKKELSHLQEIDQRCPCPSDKLCLLSWLVAGIERGTVVNASTPI